VAKFRLIKYTFVGEWNEIERRSDVVYKPDFEILRDILDEMVEASAAFTTEYALKRLEGQCRISASVRFQDELFEYIKPEIEKYLKEVREDRDFVEYLKEVVAKELLDKI
jgi:hypothetical protein